MPALLLGSVPSRLEVDLTSLTTHGFVLGMTGSGKTGLCVVLVEELLRAGVPVLAVDSKGDLGTLLLSFPPGAPELGAWTADAQAASRRIEGALEGAGLTPPGLSALLASYQPRLYTPGSTLGLPLDLLGSLAPPSDTSAEVVAEAADATVRSLLALVGIDADPLSSREYLLLVQILTTTWQAGATPTLMDLVRLVAAPPFQHLGALGLEDFYPLRERQALVVRLNGLLASPKFAAWRTGEPFDVGTLLRAPDGRPRLSVYSVAHLADEERLFAVAQLLERSLSWMRKQGGASTVRAVLLIDEIFGYFPPGPHNPPTKPPLLSLLKQARAFGLSVVLATQNPIDLDYRGLANIGTWLVGRLQTDQDKARIRDALLGAAASSGVTSAELDRLLSTLEPRKFLLHSVHRGAPAVFRTRDTWTVLRGPFSADELKRVTASLGAAPAPGATTSGPAVSAPPAVPAGLEPELGPVYEVDRGQALPFLLLRFGVRYRLNSAVSEETTHDLAFPLDGVLAPAEILEGSPSNVDGVPFQAQAPEGMTLAPLPGWVASLTPARLRSVVKERLPSKLETTLLFDPRTRLVSGPLESRDAFIARVAARQGLSGQAERLAQKLDKKKLDLANAEKQVAARKAEKWLSVGSGVMGLFAGRRSSLSSVGRVMSSQRTQGTAEARVEALTLEIQQLEHELAERHEVDDARFEERVVLPRSTDVQILRLVYGFIVP